MLARLTISNFVHVDQLTLDFEAGSCVITGETGAGKSVLLEALRIVLGGRVGPDVVRTGADLALIEAIFESSDPRIEGWRQVHGVDPLSSRPAGEVVGGSSVEGASDSPGEAARPDVWGELTLAREISERGNRCRVDGRLVTTTALRELGDLLVEACSQHDQVLLSRPPQQLDALDDFARARALRGRCEAAHKELSLARGQLLAAQEAAVRRARERDFWGFQVAEIEQGQLSDPDEVASLAGQARILASAASLRQAADQARLVLEEEARTAIGQAAHKIRSAAATDSRLADLADRLAEAQALVEDALHDLRHYSEGIDENDERLAEIEARREGLARLLRKYGPTIADALARHDELQAHLVAADQDDRAIADLARRVAGADEALIAAAAQLSKVRSGAAATLESALAAQLAELAMGGSRFEVRLSPVENGPGPHGFEFVEFLFAPGPGEVARPLGKIASGGELSRFMLALKVVMIDAFPVSTLVFDEIDAGISGAAAQKVARKLAGLAERHQVLLVTHLPTIAAIADQHVHLEKQVEAGRTRLLATILSQEGRVRELAHLLSGEGGSKAAAGAAVELLERASEFKPARAGGSKLSSSLPARREG